MQENEAKISSAKQTPIKEAKNEELLVARYAFIPYKLIKLARALQETALAFFTSFVASINASF